MTTDDEWPVPICPVCQARCRATSSIDVSTYDTPGRRMPSDFECPNLHRPWDPEWQQAAAEIAALERMLEP